MVPEQLLSTRNLQTLKKGRHFYRIFTDTVSPKAYPTCSIDNPWRFTPFNTTAENQRINGLYFADTPSACMRETIFRKGQNGVLPLSAVQHRQCIEIELKKDLDVYLLTSELLLSALGFDPVMNNDYPICLSLARVITAKFPQLQGLLFQSYQTNAHTLNLVVFSHTTSPTDFKFMTSTRDHLLSSRYRSDLLVAASSSGRELSSSVRDVCLAVTPLGL